MFRSKDLKIFMEEVKSVKNMLKSVDNNLRLLSNKVDIQAEENKRRFYELQGNMARNLSTIDETVRKSANSINVIVRFMAGSQNMNGIQLREILIDAGALTEHVKSTSDINLTDKPAEISNTDSFRSYTREIIETVDSSTSIPNRNLNTGNPSFDPINTDLPSTSTTNSTIPPIALMQNTTNQDQSSLTVNPTDISDIPNNDTISDPINSSIPSTSTTNLKIPQTSLVKNTMYHDQSSFTNNSPNISDIPYNANISDPINAKIPSTSATNSTMYQISSVQNNMYEHQSPSNIFHLSTNTRCENTSSYITVPTAIPYIDNTNREKELQEREALRKKYRNKYKYLDKYKNISEKNSTSGEVKNIDKTHCTDSSFNSVNESHSSRIKVKNVNNLRPSDAKLNDKPNSTQNFLNALKDIQPYRDSIFNGIEKVEIIYVDDRDTNSKRVTKPVTAFQPRVLIDLIDANSAEIKQRLAKADPKSCQSNSSKITDETISSDKSNPKNVANNKIIKSDKQKSETLVNSRNKRKGAMKNGQCAPPKKRASFRKQSNIK